MPLFYVVKIKRLFHCRLICFKSGNGKALYDFYQDASRFVGD